MAIAACCALLGLAACFGADFALAPERSNTALSDRRLRILAVVAAAKATAPLRATGLLLAACLSAKPNKDSRSAVAGLGVVVAADGGEKPVCIILSISGMRARETRQLRPVDLALFDSRVELLIFG